MEIYSRYNRTPKTTSPSGEKEVAVFELKINKKGAKELNITDRKEDIYTPKQLNKDDVNVLKIVERMTKTGGTSKLKEFEGQYGDLTVGAQTTIENLNQVTKIKQGFEQLPLKVKAEFGQNAFEFAEAMADGTAKERINKAMGKVEKISQTQISQTTQPVAQTTQISQTTQPVAQTTNYLN